jgi:hypothetical protein
MFSEHGRNLLGHDKRMNARLFHELDVYMKLNRMEFCMKIKLEGRKEGLIGS